MSHEAAIIEAIETAPLNRGLKGADWLAFEGNVPIVLGRDIALFDYEGENTYQVHFLFHSRGRGAVASARESFRRMFEQHGAQLIFGLVPDDLPHAKIMARWAGGRFAGKRETQDGVCELFVLSRDSWSNKK